MRGERFFDNPSQGYYVEFHRAFIRLENGFKLVVECFTLQCFLIAVYAAFLIGILGGLDRP